MSALIVVFVLLAQTLSPDLAIRGYMQADQTGEPVLAMPTGRYSVDLAPESCQDVVPGVDVDVIAGSGGVVTLSPAGHGELCEGMVTGIVSSAPCATDADGFCDIVFDSEDF